MRQNCGKRKKKLKAESLFSRKTILIDKTPRWICATNFHYFLNYFLMENLRVLVIKIKIIMIKVYEAKKKLFCKRNYLRNGWIFKTLHLETHLELIKETETKRKHTKKLFEYSWSSFKFSSIIKEFENFCWIIQDVINSIFKHGDKTNVFQVFFNDFHLIKGVQ